MGLLDLKVELAVKNKYIFNYIFIIKYDTVFF